MRRARIIFLQHVIWICVQVHTNWVYSLFRSVLIFEADDRNPLKGICQDFENFVNVLWIRSLIHVDLIGERNFEIGCIVLSIRPLIFPPKYFFENDSEKNKTLAILWRQSDSVTHWSSMSDVAIFLLKGIEHGYHFDVTYCSEWAVLVGEAWREIRPFLECV